MKFTIQKTKLYLPSPRAQLVDRPRLLQQLDKLRSPSHPVGLISAPAGSGKTTLVLQWLMKQEDYPAGWVSLDPRDNQPAIFFVYLIAAIQTIYPEVGKEALELLQLPGVNLEEVVTSLTNDLVEVSSLFLLILDDFHNITNPLISESIDLLIDTHPAQMSLLLITREDPPLQLARHRANDQLIELRHDDLRFTLPEAISFLNQCMELNLLPSQVEQLETRTEGWIAGLQMAALSLQHRPDVDGFIRDFSGSQRFILDYLMEEVLLHQSHEVQDFLLETSILERLCAGLCAAVTQKTFSEAQNLLESLTRANLFVVSLDEEGRWYRYHHLFKDLLLARLQGEANERIFYLYRRASDWYEENEEPRLAVDYALKAKDDQQAAFLLEKHFDERWQMADVDFCYMIFQLPVEIIEKRPSLCLNSAWFYILSGQFGKVSPFLEAAERELSDTVRISEPKDTVNRAFSKTIRSFLADSRNQPVDIDDTLKQAYSAIPEANTAMRNSVAVLLGTISYMEGDFTNTERYCKYAIDRDKQSTGTIAIPISVMRWVWALRAQGKLHQGLDLVIEYERYVRERGSRRFYISGVLNLLWGEILLEWNRLEEAEIQIRQGNHLLEDWTVPQSFTVGMSLLARLQVAMNDIAGAKATLRSIEEKYPVEEFHPAFVHEYYKAQTRLLIAEQNVTALEIISQKISSLAENELSFRIEAPLIELSRVWIALGRSEEAVVLLRRLSDAARDRKGSKISIKTLLAVAQRDHTELAQAALEEALLLGEQEGYLRTFLDAGEIICDVLNNWLSHPHAGISASLTNYARSILSACRSEISTQNASSKLDTNLQESLTRRELDVLRLLTEGLSDIQIAEKLVLARGTVKFYVHGILQKLGVHSRTQAIARARELKLM